MLCLQKKTKNCEQKGFSNNMPSAEWTRLADEDLLAIYRYIASQPNRQEVAVNVANSIQEHCDRYATLTAGGNVMGTDRSELRPGIRSFSHQRWVVLFRPLGDTIRVVAVYDGSREYTKAFLQRDEELG